MLARQMSLTRRQVSNSFINARVRLWNPMVEEMYKEEMGDADMGAPTAGASLRNGAPGETQTEYGIVKLSREQGPSAEECSSLFPDGIVQSYGGSDRLMAAPAAEHHMSELGRFGSGTGVSLPLGLQHCEEAAYPFPVEVITVLRVWERTIRTTHPAASSVGTETANSGSTDSAPPIYYMIL